MKTLAVLALAVTIATLAQDQTFQINTLPYTVTVPGVYEIGRNLSSAAPTLITISANDVTLDLGGHTLTSTNLSAQSVIHVKGANVTICNGSVHSLATGATFTQNSPNGAVCIFVEGSGCTLEKLSVSSPWSGTNSAIVDFSGGGNIIRDCVIHTEHSNQPSIFLRTQADIVTRNIIFTSFDSTAVLAEHSPHAAEAIFGNTIFLVNFSPPDFNPVNDDGNLIPNTLDTVFRFPG
jgi:hypothetical protein